MGEWKDPYNVLGFVGGVVLAAALLPQIYLAHKRESTADISYMWQAVYTVGLLTLMIYYAHFELWPVFYPMAFEFSCLLYLTGLKIYYEAVLTKKVVDLPTTTTVDAVSGFDASRSGRVGRVLSDASKGGVRLGRLGSDFSLAGDTSKSEMRLGWLGSKSSLAGDTSKKSGKSVVIADDDEKAGSRQGSSASGIVDPRLGGVTEAQEDLEANEHAAGTE